MYARIRDDEEGTGAIVKAFSVFALRLPRPCAACGRPVRHSERGLPWQHYGCDIDTRATVESPR